MTRDAKVTVAVLAYSGEFLRECIESVLAQTYDDIIVELRDDCSPEDLKTIVDGFDDPRLVYIRNEKNLHTFRNANKAIDECTTEYINIFHGDDKMFPWMIEKLVDVMERDSEIGIAVSSRMCALGTCNINRWSRVFPGTRYGRDGFINEMARAGRNLAVCPSAFFRKSTLDEHGLRFRAEVGPATDLYCWFEASHSGIDMYSYDVPLMETRGHDNSWTNTTTADAWSRSLKIVDDYIASCNLSIDTIEALQEYMAKMDLMMYARGVRPEDAERISARRTEIEARYGWKMRDHVFADAAAIGVVDRYVAASKLDCEKREMMRRAIAGLRKAGVKVPLIRKVKWLINHGVWVRA